MLELALSLPGTAQISYGSSKLFQILMPLLAYMMLQELPGLRSLTRRIIKIFKPQDDPANYDYLVNMLLGFFSWKIGCDLGFLIITTSAAPWSIAFTVAGLIPYTLTQYFLYYLIGHKMILQGNINPFKGGFVVRKINTRPSPVKQLVSKFLHEDMNVTSANVPLRQVLLKPFVDYGGLITSWPLYNVGLIFFQSGEVTLAPMVHFMFLKIFVFYVVNVLGYILGFNLGEFIYFRIIYLSEWVKKQVRSWEFLWNRVGQIFDTFYRRFDLTALSIEAFKARVFPPIQSFLGQYGINTRWVMSAGMGVMVVILVEPSLAGAIFATADRIQHLLFYTFGHVDQHHMQQFLSASSSVELPNPDSLIQQFPDQLDTFYAIANRSSQIGFNPL